uniref:Ig-like domain-containing protein n=1 Tax=Stegastes partitus TaxID=144197 RepID=A0A3B5B2P8_9TELE
MGSRCLTSAAFISTGQVSAVTFHQLPSRIVTESSEVHINCSHDDSSLIIMLWYQQKQDNTALTLIGFGYEMSENYEGQFEEQFKLTRRSATEGALMIKKANQSHSAVYFCAASTQ